jgi:RimJ/RimL family protein N-acetyltransferase
MVSRDLRLLTPRLVLRPTEPEDAARLCEIRSDWDVTRMLRMADWPPDPVAMQAWVASHPAEWARGEAYRFAVLFEGRLIGQADIDEIAGGEGDLGYWLERPTWGAGLASEAARALVEFAFGDLALRRIRSGHAVENVASGRILEKLGFHALDVAPRPSRPRQELVLHRRMELRTTLDFATGAP